MKGFLIAAAALLAGAAGPALAETRAAEPSVTASAAAATPAAQIGAREQKPTRYCYLTEQTGTRITKKVCQTREEWRSEGVIVPANK